MRNHAFKPARVWILAFVLLLGAFAPGCGDKLDPTDPEGAFNLFRDAIFQGDGEAMWARMAPSSHQYFDDQLVRLRRMDEKIGRYLPPADHKLARKQAGSVLTDDLADGKALFLHILRPQNIPADEKYQVGMDVEEIKISEDEEQAAVVTRGKQEVLLRHDKETDEWFVMFVESNDVIPTAMGWLDKNEKALDQTIEDLIDEERRERESVISELLGYEPKEGSDSE